MERCNEFYSDSPMSQCFLEKGHLPATQEWMHVSADSNGFPIYFFRKTNSTTRCHSMVVVDVRACRCILPEGHPKMSEWYDHAAIDEHGEPIYFAHQWYHLQNPGE